MNRLITISLLALALVCAASVSSASAQESRSQRFRAHNADMTAVQPSWMAPLIQTDSRLGQGIKISVSNSQAPGVHQIIYGNGHGFGFIVARRFQFDYDPPSFFRNHSPALKDGFGNAAAQIKYRIASGNAEHGNFAFTAVLSHDFPQRGCQNGNLTSINHPKLGAGRAFGRFNLQTMLDGSLPTGKIALQGRSIGWNTTAQLHPDPHVWLDLEDNATFNHGGPCDGTTQNFITPAAFYMVRRKSWGLTHALLTFDAGMQIATTRFHSNNHNLITEMRVGF